MAQPAFTTLVSAAALTTVAAVSSFASSARAGEVYEPQAPSVASQRSTPEQRLEARSNRLLVGRAASRLQSSGQATYTTPVMLERSADPADRMVRIEERLKAARRDGGTGER